MEQWMVTPEEIEEYQSTPVSTDVSSIVKSVDYLMGKDEAATIKRELAREKQKKQLKPTTGFVKVHKSLMEKVGKIMFTLAEKALMFDLIPFCNIETNVITDENGLPMSQNDIHEKLDHEKRHLQKLLNSLVDKGVIEKMPKGKTTFYKFSKEYVG